MTTAQFSKLIQRLPHDTPILVGTSPATAHIADIAVSVREEDGMPFVLVEPRVALPAPDCVLEGC